MRDAARGLPPVWWTSGPCPSYISCRSGRLPRVHQAGNGPLRRVSALPSSRSVGPGSGSACGPGFGTQCPVSSVHVLFGHEGSDRRRDDPSCGADPVEVARGVAIGRCPGVPPLIGRESREPGHHQPQAPVRGRQEAQQTPGASLDTGAEHEGTSETLQGGVGVGQCRRCAAVQHLGSTPTPAPGRPGSWPPLPVRGRWAPIGFAPFTRAEGRRPTDRPRGGQPSSVRHGSGTNVVLTTGC
jgi:hypothetical protein